MSVQESVELPNLLTIDEAAEYLGVSRRTIYNLISSRKLPVVKIGAQTRIDAEDLRRYVEAQKQRGV